MIIIQDTLSQELLQRCIDETSEKMKLHCWRPSSFFWEDAIRIGIQAPCLISPVSEELAGLIESEVKGRFPSFDYLTIQHYVWLPNSGIALHNDSHVKFGATIYLNDDWGPNNGGFFIWKEKTEENWNTIIPKQNVMMINDKQELHLVTPVSSATSKFRVTIQIWGHDPFTKNVSRGTLGN